MLRCSLAQYAIVAKNNVLATIKVLLLERQLVQKTAQHFVPPAGRAGFFQHGQQPFQQWLLQVIALQLRNALFDLLAQQIAIGDQQQRQFEIGFHEHGPLIGMLGHVGGNRRAPVVQLRPEVGQPWVGVDHRRVRNALGRHQALFHQQAPPCPQHAGQMHLQRVGGDPQFLRLGIRIGRHPRPDFLHFGIGG